MAQSPSSPPPHSTQDSQSSKKPWPMSWIVIAILAYITFQVAYFLFFAG